MCKDFLDDVVGIDPVDTSESDNLQRQALDEAKAARAATEAALAKAEAAMVDPRDSESGRQAAERAQKKRRTPAADIFSGSLGEANVGVATLFGQA